MMSAAVTRTTKQTLTSGNALEGTLVRRLLEARSAHRSCGGIAVGLSFSRSR
jgi:hypothetical protein